MIRAIGVMGTGEGVSQGGEGNLQCIGRVGYVVRGVGDDVVRRESSLRAGDDVARSYEARKQRYEAVRKIRANPKVPTRSDAPQPAE